MRRCFSIHFPALKWQLWGFVEKKSQVFIRKEEKKEKKLKKKRVRNKMSYDAFPESWEQSLVKHPNDLEKSRSLHATRKGDWVLCVHREKGEAAMLKAKGCASSSKHCRVTFQQNGESPTGGFVQEADFLQSC